MTGPISFGAIDHNIISKLFSHQIIGINLMLRLVSSLVRMTVANVVRILRMTVTDMIGIIGVTIASVSLYILSSLLIVLRKNFNHGFIPLSLYFLLKNFLAF
jgi:hypothetical protein